MPSWAWLALAAAALLGLVAPLAAAESISGDREQQAEGYRVSLLKDGAVNTWKSYLHSYTSYTTRNWYTRGRVDETKTRVERQRGECDLSASPALLCVLNPRAFATFPSLTPHPLRLSVASPSS